MRRRGDGRLDYLVGDLDPWIWIGWIVVCVPFHPFLLLESKGQGNVHVKFRGKLVGHCRWVGWAGT